MLEVKHTIHGPCVNVYGRKAIEIVAKANMFDELLTALQMVEYAGDNIKFRSEVKTLIEKSLNKTKRGKKVKSIGEEQIKDYYEKVGEFRSACGIIQTDADLHKKLYAEEVGEYYEAEEQADIADALADMIFIYSGAHIDLGPIIMDEDSFWSNVCESADRHGINLKGAFDLVYESNMSKLVGGDEVSATTDKYTSIGVLVEYKQISDNLYAVYSASEQTGSDGALYPKGKLLKSIGYKEPEWSQEGRWKIQS